MRPGESFVGQPIRSLQTMLRVLAQYDGKYASVVPDGIYGPQTMAAVAHFQRLHGLRVTGVTDQQTWDMIVNAYEPALVHMDSAQTLEIILNPSEVITLGQSSPNMFVVQALLAVLSQVYGSVGAPSHSGTLDTVTAESLSSFQALSGLPMTGNLDKITWKHLALQYPLASNLQSKRSRGEEGRPI